MALYERCVQHGIPLERLGFDVEFCRCELADFLFYLSILGVDTLRSR